MTRSDSFNIRMIGGMFVKHQHKDQRQCLGCLPSKAPLANAFVPFQPECSPMYEAEKGMVRGTMYPCLDLPFMGMVNRKNLNTSPKTQLQTLAFAIQELALYLDTHREDCDALKLYQSYQQMYQKCMEEYQRKRGPLTHRHPSDGGYRWLDDPWPWEYCANKEG